MHSADRMDLLDKWDPEFEDVGTLSLDEIYQELSRLDAFERFISSKQGQNGPDNPDKEVNDDTNAGKDGEDNPETRQKTVLRDINTRRIALRAGAMELSRAKIRPTTIVDLPADILLQIFEGWYDISPVLSAVNWPRVERISISNVSSKQDELESFCSGLGPSTRRLSLRAIHLLDGSWEGILRTLDEKMRSTFLEQNVRVYLSDLTGGEFGEVEIRERTPLFGFEDSDDEVEPPKPPPAAGELLKKQYAPFFSIW